MSNSSCRLSGGGQEGRGGGFKGRGGGHVGGSGGGIEAVVSIDESGMSDMAKTGRAAHITPELVGRGPAAAVIDMGDSFRSDTPFMETSVGELISNGFWGGAGGRGWARG